MIKIFNQNQLEYISNQLATMASILFGTLVITNFLPDNKFNLKTLLISFGITLGFYTAGVLLRHNSNA